ncbi:MAG: cytochrome P450 [Nannocystaceae bacterium]
MSTFLRSAPLAARTKRPPGPVGVDALATMIRLVRAPYTTLQAIQRRHGDVARFRIGATPVLLVSHPELVEQVLVHRRKDYGRDALIRKTNVLFGSGLLVAEGELWARQRKLMAPCFAQRSIVHHGEVMAACAEAAAAGWREGETLDLGEAMMAMTLEIATRTLFGSTSAGQGERLGAALATMVDYFMKMAFNPLAPPLWVPTPGNRRFLAARAIIHEVVDEVIRRRRDRAGVDRPEGGRFDLLGTLMAARDDEGRGMSDQQLRDEVLTLLLAGHETTALALTYTIHLLARHPWVLARLEEELDEVLGGRTPTVADLDHLPYTRQVVLEGMRLYPPVATSGREALADDELAGYPVPAGSLVMSAQWVIQRDPRFFAAPEVFRPERWTPDFERALPRFAYFPFGGGSRVCIGQAFALLEARLCLAALIQRWRLAAVDPAPIEVVPSITVRPRSPVQMRLTRRAPG